jgi:transposase
VYLDESGFAVDMPRMRGYSRIGNRCYGSCNWHARGRVNVIGASINMKLISICLFDAHIDSDIFYQWTIDFLLPELRQSSVIVLDNATFHKRHDIQQAIANAGHTLEYLPPYSPDLNEIEHK